jgi:hypothetical protein
VIQAESSNPPSGKLTIQHFAKGKLDNFGFSPRWFTDIAYDTITIANTGTSTTTYDLQVTSVKNFTVEQFFPVTILGIGERDYQIYVASGARGLQIGPGEQKAVQLFYKTAQGGEMPDGPIDYSLIARTEDGTYLPDFQVGHFGTTYLDANDQPVDRNQLPSGILLTEAPLHSSVTQFGKSQICGVVIYVNNPLEAPLLISLAQPFPPGSTVTDAAGGIVTATQIIWELNLQPGQTRALRPVLGVSTLPSEQQFPNTTASVYDTLNATWLQFQATPSLVEVSNTIPVRVQSRGFSSGRFGITVENLALGTYRIEATTDFKSWSEIVTATNQQGNFDVADTDASSHFARFYRVIKIQ